MCAVHTSRSTVTGFSACTCLIILIKCSVCTPSNGYCLRDGLPCISNVYLLACETQYSYVSERIGDRHRQHQPFAQRYKSSSRTCGHSRCDAMGLCRADCLHTHTHHTYCMNIFESEESLRFERAFAQCLTMSFGGAGTTWLLPTLRRIVRGTSRPVR